MIDESIPTDSNGSSILRLELSRDKAEFKKETTEAEADKEEEDSEPLFKLDLRKPEVKVAKKEDEVKNLGEEKDEAKPVVSPQVARLPKFSLFTHFRSKLSIQTHLDSLF